MAENKKKYKARSKMSMSSYQDKHESKHKMHMRLITLIIALITILGLVIIIPFADAAVGAVDETTAAISANDEITDGADSEQVMAIGDGLPDVRVTSQGAGMFTLRNAALIGGGFVVGFLLGELFRKVNKIRDAKNSD